MKSLAALTFVFCGIVAAVAAEPELLLLEGDLAVHDPAVIKEAGKYYLFATGGRRSRGILPVVTSPDMRRWTRAGFCSSGCRSGPQRKSRGRTRMGA